MLERFTDPAQAVLMSANDGAKRMGHNFIGCEHILLAVASDEGEVGQLLKNMGITPPAVEREMSRLLGQPRPALDRQALAAIGIDIDLVEQKVDESLGPGALQAAAAAGSQVCIQGGCGRWYSRRFGRGSARRRQSPQLRASATGVQFSRPFTPRAKKCLELSLGEAHLLGVQYVGVAHIALALSRMASEGESAAAPILRAIGVPASELRTALGLRYRPAS